VPYQIRKLPNKNRYRVYNKVTKKIYAFSTTKANALKQLVLLESLERRR
jgi:hypothetical protein